MSSPRLLVGAAVVALASAALPATASATLKRTSPYPTPDTSATYGSGNLTYTDFDNNLAFAPTPDGILAPGENANFDFPLVDDQTDGSNAYDGSAKGQLFVNGSGAGIANPAGGNASPTIRNFPYDNGSFTNDVPYKISVDQNVVCGTNVPLRLSFSTLGPLDVAYGLQTGAPGAYHTTESHDVGNIVADGGTKDSVVTIADPGLLKGLRIHIDSIQHQYSTHWLKIKLVSPSGKSAMLFNQVPFTIDQAHPHRTFNDVTFSETPVNGVKPVEPEVAASADFQHQVVLPAESLSVFDGEALTGNWHLLVSDVKAIADNRSNHRARSVTLGGLDRMFQLGSWQMSDSAAVCNAKPQAWLDEPLIVDPDGGTVDGSGSNSPGPGTKITKYEWSMNPTDQSPTWTSTGTNPKLTIPPTPATKKPIALRVTNSAGVVSDPVTRTLVITKKPVFDANITPAPTDDNLISYSPVNPKAGDKVTMTAHATDAESTPDKLTYNWDLNDDGVFADATGTSAQVTWPTSGPHIVRVQVIDGDGAASYYYQTITIANLPPTAKFTFSPTVPVVGQPITFDGSGSTDTDGTIAEYDWDFDGSGLYASKTTTPTIPYTFPQAGNQFVRLRVVDNTGGTDEISATIHVTGAPVGVVSASPASPAIGETVTFSASGSHDSDPDGTIAKYEWDLDGNGSWDVTGATASTATRAYPNAGAVAVKLRVTDNDGAASVTPFTLVVRNPSTGGGLGGGVLTPTPTPKAGTGTGTGTGPGSTALGSSPVTQALFPTLPDTVQSGNTGAVDAKAAITPDSIAASPKGFVASIATGAKQHGSKTYKKGIAVNYKANTAGTLTVSLMVLPKYAKTVKLKLKGTKLVTIGTGKVVATKAGTFKFTVVVAKKYQKYIKKATKLPVELRAVAKSKTTGETLAIGKKFTYVK